MDMGGSFLSWNSQLCPAHGCVKLASRSTHGRMASGLARHAAGSRWPDQGRNGWP